MRVSLSWIAALFTVVIAAGQDFTPLRYGDPEKTVDLAVGLWSYPLPMDYDGDGDHDLLVACPDKPANGVYFFENVDGRVKRPRFKAAVRLGPARHSMMPSYVNGDVRVLAAGVEFTEFRKTGFKETKPVYSSRQIHPRSVRQNVWRYVDYNGDGHQDLIVGVGDWTDYGWDMAYDWQGRWRNGPLHGHVYHLINNGTDAEPNYADPVLLEAGGAPIDVYGWPSPNFADFDGDGDLDLICGEFLDGFTYFENTGKRREPSYSSGRRLNHQGTPITMDLQMIVPVAIDWDHDGDQDLIVGDEDGRVALIEHTGKLSQGLPAFLPPVYFQQEADTLNAGALATPYSVDWDSDGDEDLLVGNTAGYILYFENLDGGNPPQWTVPRKLKTDGQVIRIQAGPNGSIQGPCEAKWGYTTLSVADWDHDGVLDILVNSIWGEVLWCRGLGGGRLDSARSVPLDYRDDPPQNPQWNWWSPKEKQLVTQWRTTPVAVDWNKDGLTDLVMLDSEGYLCFYRRFDAKNGIQLAKPQRLFVNESLEPIQLATRSAGGSGRFKLAVADWDGDGRLDVLVNSENAALYQNIADHEGKVVLTKRGNLGKQNLAGHTSSPTICDWNRDGLPELLVGSESGMIYHLPREKASEFPAVDWSPAAEEAIDTIITLQEFVFTRAPFPQCHASTIAETPRGLACAWFGGTHEKHQDVGIWVSYHDGRSWSRPREVANGVQYEGHRHPCWNPVLHQEPNGPLLLFFKCGPNPREWWGEMIESFDGGRTWRNRRRLPEGIDGPVKNKPFILADGSLLCPSSTEYDGWRVHMEHTRDLGRTWHRYGPIDPGADIQAIQPSILKHRDGRLQILCRSRNGRIATSFSEDQGKTWTPLTLTELPNPSAGTDAVNLADGQHLLVYNHRTEGRGSLTVARSVDGETWQPICELENEEGQEFSYPAVIQARDGRVHITYTWKRQRVKHVVLTLP